MNRITRPRHSRWSTQTCRHYVCKYLRPLSDVCLETQATMQCKCKSPRCVTQRCIVQERMSKCRIHIRLAEILQPKIWKATTKLSHVGLTFARRLQASKWLTLRRCIAHCKLIISSPWAVERPMRSSLANVYGRASMLHVAFCNDIITYVFLKLVFAMDRCSVQPSSCAMLYHNNHRLCRGSSTQTPCSSMCLF